ncbi:MAG: metallophosphoesterase family protein [Celeribacter sp.]|jgi:putative phosphoesterase
MIVGVISDTHGLLRPEAVAALQGVDAILHGGDIGPEQILSDLERIAPVTAIRGNVDTAQWCAALPKTRVLTLAGVAIHMLHDLKTLRADPVAEGYGVVISGHSHKPLIERRDGVLYLNPGSAGRRRFRLPVTLARLDLRAASAPQAELLTLDV